MHASLVWVAERTAADLDRLAPSLPDLQPIVAAARAEQLRAAAREARRHLVILLIWTFCAGASFALIALAVLQRLIAHFTYGLPL